MYRTGCQITCPCGACMSRPSGHLDVCERPYRCQWLDQEGLNMGSLWVVLCTWGLMGTHVTLRWAITMVTIWAEPKAIWNPPSPHSTHMKAPYEHVGWVVAGCPCNMNYGWLLDVHWSSLAESSPCLIVIGCFILVLHCSNWLLAVSLVAFDYYWLTRVHYWLSLAVE